MLAVALLVGTTAAIGTGSPAGAAPSGDDPERAPWEDGGAPADQFDYARASATIVRPIVFPVDGQVARYDDFGACRSGCSRRHEGNDLIGRKGQRLLSTVDGTVTRIEDDANASGTQGNYIVVTDDAGWRYIYIHVNNDTPGTDDARNPAEWRFPPGIAEGVRVTAGQHIAYMGDSGNAEYTVDHLHFEIRDPSGYWGDAIDPHASLDAARVVAPQPRFLLRDSSGSGIATHQVGLGTSEATGLLCDWDGDGVDTPAVHIGNRFVFTDDVATGSVDHVAYFGRPDDLPFCGDWDGDGRDTIGVRRQTDRNFYLRNELAGGPADITLTYGYASDDPVVGDWDGDGRDTFGVRRGRQFLLRNANSSGPADIDITYGVPTDTPIVGDFDGDGRDSIGIRRSAEYYLRNSLSSGIADVTYRYGVPADQAIMGDVSGRDIDTPGVFRPA